MFNSISNNFGAGVIQFKDVRESNYIVLNSVFTFRADSPAYQAAEVLEISVPDLNIDRSTETGVIIRYLSREMSYGYPYVCDGGTVLKSWIKDKNTICIEKLPHFDDQEELIIYIQTIYLQLNQGGNASKGTRKSITIEQAEKYLYFGYDTFVVIYPKWVFLHIDFSSSSYAYRNLDWSCVFEGLPSDVKADVPIIGAANYKNDKLGGVNVCHIEDCVWSMKAEDRNMGFENTGNYVFGMAYLIRDNQPVPDVPGRLRIAENPIKGGTYIQMNDFDLEVEPELGSASIAGSTGQYSKTTVTFYPVSVPEDMPSFRAFYLGRMMNGSGLCIQLISMEMDALANRKPITFTRESGETNIVFKTFDTSAIMALNE